MQAKDKMFKVPAGEIGTNDVVVIEAHISRFRVDDADNLTYRGPWKRFKTSFDITAINLLARGSDDLVPDEDPGVDDDKSFTL